MNFTLLNGAHYEGLDNYTALTSTQTDDVMGRIAAVSTSWGAGLLAPGEAGSFTLVGASGMDFQVDAIGGSANTMTLTDVRLMSAFATVWVAQGATQVDASVVDFGITNAELLTGNDTIYGNAFSNVLRGWGGNDYIDGGPGTDTVILAGALSQYTYTQSGGVITTAGWDGVDTLVNVERIHFDDYGLAFDTQGAAGEAFRLYQAAFDRTPDLAGLGYQMAALDNGWSLSQVAANFIASPEFQYTYGTLSNTSFVTQLYENVLHRAPDAGGLAYHVSHLNAGVSRADVLVGFSESPENQAAVIGSIEHGMLYV